MPGKLRRSFLTAISTNSSDALMPAEDEETDVVGYTTYIVNIENIII